MSRRAEFPQASVLPSRHRLHSSFPAELSKNCCALIFAADGTADVKDWDDVTVTYNVVADQPFIGNWKSVSYAGGNVIEQISI